MSLPRESRGSGEGADDKSKENFSTYIAQADLCYGLCMAFQVVTWTRLPPYPNLACAGGGLAMRMEYGKTPCPSDAWLKQRFRFWLLGCFPSSSPL